MQKRAGILFISKKTSRIFLLLENSKWAVPTFTKIENVIEDSMPLIEQLSGSLNKLIPIELYISDDNGFEFNTYVCLTDQEFIPNNKDTFSWNNLDQLPKNIHTGLKSSLNNKFTRNKIETILLMSQTL
jgi:hypothetical protein